MSSAIDPTLAADLTTAVNVRKAQLQTALTVARDEVNHGGFYKRLGAATADQQVATGMLDLAVNPRDFGNGPNFSEVTEGPDCAPGINAAIDAVVANWGRGTVFLAPGVWWIGSSIINKPNVTVRGAGMESTVIKLTSAAACHAFQNAASTDVKYGVEDLTIDGNRDGATNRRRFSDGIRWQSTVDSEPHIQNVRIRNITRDCIHLEGNRMRCMGHNLRLHSANRYGMYVSTFDNIWSNFEIAGIGADGIWLDQGFNYFTHGNIFFTGNGSAQKDEDPFNNFFGESWLGMTTTAIHAETTPVAADWTRGCYIRINGGWCCSFDHVGGQDSYGPAVSLGAGGTGLGQHRFTNCYFSNVGDLAPSGARHGTAGWATTVDDYASVRAIVETFATVDCFFDIQTRQQGTTFASESTMCNYPWRNRNINCKNCYMRVIIPEFQSNLSAATHVTNQTVLETAVLDASNVLVVNQP